MQTLTFQNITISPVKQDNQIWLSSSDLAKSLGYSRADKVTQLYNANADEFTSSMTALIPNPQMKNANIRIFSLRGCHLIAMFSRTTIAKDFRKWVLDILDKEVGEPSNVRHTISVEQQAQIRQAVAKRCKSNSEHYQSIYSAVHARFNIPRYDELLAIDFDECMDFIKDFSFDEKQPFFLHKQAAHEFDVRLHHIFDLASLMIDNPTANLIKRRAEELNRFLVNYQNKYLL